MAVAYALVMCLVALAPVRGLAARRATPAAFDALGIPASGVAAPSNTGGTLARCALPTGGIARLGATRDVHHGLLEPAKVAGVWSFSVELAIGTGHPTVTLKQDGEKITGTYDGRYGPAPIEGTVKDQKIEFTVSMTAEGTAVTGVFTGTVQEDGMTGTVDFEGAGDGTWTAVRKAAPK